MSELDDRIVEVRPGVFKRFGDAERHEQFAASANLAERERLVREMFRVVIEATRQVPSELWQRIVAVLPDPAATLQAHREIRDELVAEMTRDWPPREPGGAVDL